MNETETIWAAQDVGVKLDVDPATLEVVARPKQKITPMLRAGIKENRDGLVRHLLLIRALGYVAHRGLEHVESEAVETAEDNLNRACLHGSLREFQRTVRSWLEAKVRASRAGERVS